MDKLVGAILTVFLVIAAIYVICVVVAYIVLGLLIVAAVAGPLVLAGLGLRGCVRRFQLSRRKVWECVLLGLVLAVLPLLAIPAAGSMWPAAVWAACFVGLASPMTYLAVGGYHQVYWPHRKAALAAGGSATRLGWALWSRRRRLNRVQNVIRRDDKRHGDLRHERERILAVTREIVLRTDPAFYSAEVARWTRACTAMPDHALWQRAGAVTPDAMITTLERAVQHMPEFVNQRPEQIRGLLGSAVIHAEIIRRATSSRDGSYEDAVREAATLQSEIDTLSSRLASARDSKMRSVQRIAQLRQERVSIQ